MLTCPSCGTIMDPISGECVSISCDRDHFYSDLITHYMSAIGAHWHWGFIEDLMDAGLVVDLSDLYRLTVKDISKITTNKVIAKELLRPLSENQKLEDILYGIGAEGITRQTAKVLATKYKDIWRIVGLTKEELSWDMPEECVHNTYVFFQRPDILELLVELDAVDAFSIYSDDAIAGNRISSNKLKGKCIVFTGKLEKMTRSEASMNAESVGAYPQKVVGNGTDYLVCGLRVGDIKTNAARKHGTICLTEDQWMYMYNEAKLYVK